MDLRQGQICVGCWLAVDEFLSFRPCRSVQFITVICRYTSSRLTSCRTYVVCPQTLNTEPAAQICTLRLKCDSTRAETGFRLSAKQTSPFKSGGASVQSTIGSRGVRIIGSNVGYTMFRGSVKSTGYPLHSPVFSSLPLLCVTLYHHISTGRC